MNFRFTEPKEQELAVAVANVVTTLVLLAVGIGLALFTILWLRSTAPRAPLVFLRGYEKVPPRGTPLSPDPFRDRIKDDDNEDEEEEEEDEDIVYMGQDGTVYRKFKYGLLDENEDDDDELEYDDDSCAIISANTSTQTCTYKHLSD